jgi:3-oxoacyl-[acyl-carrier protein] reductase
MQSGVNDRHALVLGGTGVVGRAVLRELAGRGVSATFTYWRSEEKARVLALEYGHRAVQVNLADARETRKCLEGLANDQPGPDVLIHCAGVNSSRAFEDIDSDTFEETISVNAQSAFLACQWLAAQRPKNQTANMDIVLVGALDRTQSLPLPVHFAASQGMLGAMVMAIAHELGPRGVRINMVALGILNEGLSQGLLAQSRKDYETFSALRRVGTPDEAARTIVWLALENRYIQGKIVPVNGGI